MLSHRFREHITTRFHLHPSSHIIFIAVSGGIDSTVLTHLFHQLKFECVLLHCNFHLRAEESNRDENFIRTLSNELNVELHVKNFDTTLYAEQNKLSIQEAARNLRYNWFAEMIAAYAGKKKAILATAHNANDNIETMLMHFFRGTGIEGLTGIPEYDKARNIIRPLLFATRKEIEAFANDNLVKWVEDSSNATDKYTRNFFRLNLLPAIADVFPNVENNLLHNVTRFKEATILYRQTLDKQLQKLRIEKGNELHIPVLLLKKSETLQTLLFELTTPYNFKATQLPELVKLLNAANGSTITSSTHRIIKNRNWLIIAPLATTEAKYILIEHDTAKVAFENGTIQLTEKGNGLTSINTAADTASFNADAVTFPLLLRTWKQGDYFYPLGMKGKKKISRFLIDLKLSATEKEKVWVIESDKRIAWVVGFRMDDRFKIKPSTQKVFQLTYTAAGK